MPIIDNDAFLAAERLYQKNYRQANKEKLAAYFHDYGIAHRAKRREQARKRYATNPQERERIRIYNAARHAANPEKSKLRGQAYYRKNADRILEKEKLLRTTDPEFRRRSFLRAKKYAELHPEQVKKSQQASRKRHPETARQAAKNRRARVQGATTIKFTAADWKRMQELCDHRCTYCGKRCKGRLTQDHVLALIKGGQHCWDNITPACSHCNSKKSVKAPPVPVQMVMQL